VTETHITDDPASRSSGKAIGTTGRIRTPALILLLDAAHDSTYGTANQMVFFNFLLLDYYGVWGTEGPPTGTAPLRWPSRMPT